MNLDPLHYLGILQLEEVRASNVAVEASFGEPSNKVCDGWVLMEEMHYGWISMGAVKRQAPYFHHHGPSVGWL